MTGTEGERLCRNCGRPEHIPADACLTDVQRVGRILGIIALVGLFILLIAGATGNL